MAIKNYDSGWKGVLGHAVKEFFFCKHILVTLKLCTSQKKKLLKTLSYCYPVLETCMQRTELPWLSMDVGRKTMYEFEV